MSEDFKSTPAKKARRRSDRTLSIESANTEGNDEQKAISIKTRKKSMHPPVSDQDKRLYNGSPNRRVLGMFLSSSELNTPFSFQFNSLFSLIFDHKII